MFFTNGKSLDNDDVSAFVLYLEWEGATAAKALLQPWIVHVVPDVIYYYTLDN